jgi:hypothetical protein
MELEITPEPPEPVRRAIEIALGERDGAGPSAWWAAGVAESVGADDAQAGARPRSSDGAERA